MRFGQKRWLSRMAGALAASDITPSSSAVYLLITTTRLVIDAHCCALDAIQPSVCLSTTRIYSEQWRRTCAATKTRQRHEHRFGAWRIKPTQRLQS
jgi:hypothetical protein